jgi:hypothetical protein
LYLRKEVRGGEYLDLREVVTSGVESLDLTEEVTGGE